ncbi:Vesicle transport through interaction with t-SNAREs homolog 1B [Geodia barretti]|uniref:Vesicle transport through interaction with t-SNAREs homolog 1B n=1 Tax=Geodia barretti TaxID=519541 RepID=A0AA35U013_GEOBA|nr:Vesicle transport through interaction with t-SNAREs homolog 1B [Geodia barretti]
MSIDGIEERERQLKVLLKELGNEISLQLPSNYGEDRRRRVQKSRQKLDQAESLLREMQLDVRVAPKGIQHQLFSRVTQYKADVASLRHQLAGERDQLLKKTATLQRASQSLHRAQHVTAETDEIADNIVLDLGQQRATLVRARDRVAGIETEMERTKSLLRTIACKAIENRIILITVIVIELVLLAGLAYWKFLS